MFHVSRGNTKQINPRIAVQELWDQVDQPDAHLTLFFCSSHYDLDELAKAFRETFTHPVVGCTTAGELSANGYTSDSISVVTFGGDSILPRAHFIPDVLDFTVEQATAFCADVADQLERDRLKIPDSKSLALLLVDGMATMEDQLTAMLDHLMVGVPVVGGSAGDDLQFKQTWIYYNGEFHSRAAMVIAITTDHPFKFFKYQNFVPSAEKIVVTQADLKTRRIFEMNGEPAGKEYARLIGIDPSDLRPQTYAGYPLALRDGGNYYLRSVAHVNPDASMTFACSIDEGLILYLSHATDLMTNLDALVDDVEREIGEPLVTVAFDCALRRVVIDEESLTEEAGKRMIRLNSVGFNTYGEQINGVHMNQTITGVSFGPKRAAA